MAKKKEIQEEGKIQFYTEEIKKSKTINDDTVKAITFIIVLLVVVGLLALLFFLNGKYVSKDKYQDDTTTTTTEAIYDDTQTTVNTMFNLSGDTYYVLAYDSTDETNGNYMANLGTSFQDEKIKLYTLDLSNAMNKQFYNKDKDTVVKSKKETNFKSYALVIFKKGKVSEVLTNKEDIVNKLGK